ncbi:MAG TPA: metallophosphoesterase [Actinomycetes bacterium]|nr:metallophosphoesterase [Actinomycetes bacterium]
MRRRFSLPLTTAAVGAAGLAYAVWEAKQFRLRRVDIPVLAADADPLRILHISDLHLTPGQQGKIEWVQSLASLRPDLVVSTGDNLAHLEAVPATLSALAPLLDVPGVFVFGSNDYYGPILKNPFGYFRPDRPIKVFGKPLPWTALRDGLTSAGWVDLNNHRVASKAADRLFEFVGTDDAHLQLDHYDDVTGPPDQQAELAIGVTHAPYLRVVDRMAADAIPMIFAGHTHGGQVCVPGLGALVTNCDLPRSQAKGLHRRGDTWLHVSAGLGTSPTAPIRFACPPEATLVTLTPAI